MKLATKIQQRFERKFYLTPSCWIWTASTSNKGYGQFRIGRKNFGAHRVAYELYREAIPRHTLIRHTCDNPACVNPSHMLLGSAKENAQDAIDRGRLVAGIKHHAARLTPSKVQEIRILITARNHSQAEIARHYKISASVITEIKNEKAWRVSP